MTKDQLNHNKMYGSFGQWAWSSIDGGDHIDNISTKEITADHFLSTGMENIVGNALDVNDADPNIVYIGVYDIGFWYSKNHGKSWKRSLPDVNTYPEYVWYAGGGSNCNFVLSDPENENVVWASFSEEQPDTQSAVFKSTEFGENWTMSNNGLNPLGLGTHGLSLDINSPKTNRILYLTQNGNVFKPIDGGANWTSIFTNGGLKFTEVDKFDGQLIYAGGENGFWRSTDGGDNWAEVGPPEMRFTTTIADAIKRTDIIPTFGDDESDPQIVPWQGVFEIKADPNIANRVYVVAYGTDKGLYRSDDAGITWRKLYTNDRMRGVAIASQNSDIIYTSSSLSYHSGGFDDTSIGILVSYDAGETWVSANEGMAWTNGGRLDIETGEVPHVWAWSPGTGVQHALIPNFSGSTVSTAPTLNTDIILYPNPVKDKLTIDLTSFSKGGKAVIFSMDGRLAKELTLNSDALNTINVKNLASGLYILRFVGAPKDFKFIKR